MRLSVEFSPLTFFGRYCADETIIQRFSLYMTRFTYIVAPPDDQEGMTLLEVIPVLVNRLVASPTGLLRFQFSTIRVLVF